MVKLFFALSLLFFKLVFAQVDSCTAANLLNVVNTSVDITSSMCYSYGSSCCFMTLNYTIPQTDPLQTGYNIDGTYCATLSSTDPTTVAGLMNSMINIFS